MDILPIDDRDTWDQALLDLASPHVLQTWDWGAFKARHGWHATRLLFQERGMSVGAATILRRRLPLLPLSILYVPKGPVVNWHNATRAVRALGALETFAREQRAIFVKVDPDVYYPDTAPAFSPRPTVAPAIARLLEVRGWRFSADQIQYRNTVLVDLAAEEAMLAAMKPKGRYNVRLAERHGVEVRDGSRDELPLFYDLYAATAARGGFAIRPPAYYLDAWHTFLDAGRAIFLLAEAEGDVVAGLVLFHFGKAAWYMYGASSERHRERMPNNLLQWEAMRRARAAGCTLYDLWGAPDDLDDESDPMHGVYRFKLALGGQPARGVGAWDFVVRPRLYRYYTEVIPRYLALLRTRAG